MVKANAAATLETVMNWIGGYMSMPDHYRLVVGLWILNTHLFDLWDAVPFLGITAATKGSGKSTLLELTSMVAAGGDFSTSPTMSTMYRSLDAARQHDQPITLCFDEFEAASNESDERREFLNAAYRRGGSVKRTMPGGEVKRFDCYGPIAFALIGDVYDTLRDRTIMLTLERGKAERRYRPGQAMHEATEIREALASAARAVRATSPDIVEIDHLSGRAAEIWEPLFSLAAACGLSKAQMDTLTRASADLTAAKTAEARRYVELKHAEDKARDITYSERALRDLARVIREDEPAIFTAVAVQRMKELIDGPWRMYRGEGLTGHSLGDLLSPFGVKSAVVRMVKGKGASKAERLNGYDAGKVRAAARALDGDK